jgi:hypothetical protein
MHSPLPKLKIAQKGQVRQIRQLEAEVASLLEQRRDLASHMPLREAGGREVMRLEQKAIIDRVKMTAYNAEEWLLERLAPYYPSPHDIRQLLRSFAELSGEIRRPPRHAGHPRSPTHPPPPRCLAQALR